MARTHALSFIACALASACTLDAGHGFATMKEGELRMELEVGEDRELEDGAFSTDRGYRIQPRELSVHVEHVVVLQEGVASEAEEPSHCHGDHCHAEDEHATEAGEGESSSVLVEAHVDRAFDLIEGERVELADFEPSAELPESTIDRLEIEVTELHLRAEINGGELSEPAQLEVDLELEVPLTKTVSLAIDRDGPEEVALHIIVHFDATALDGIDLASLVEDGAVVIGEDAPEAAALIEWLERAEIDAAF